MANPRRYPRNAQLTHLSLLLCIVLNIHINFQSFFADAAVPHCFQSVSKPTVPKETCARQRIELAIRRHQTYIFGPNGATETIYLRCPICSESDVVGRFEWKFIPRRLNVRIFISKENPIYGSNWTLDKTLFRDVAIIGSNNPCTDRFSNDLQMKISDVLEQTGTYVCTYPGDDNHPANYIWYHVDQIASHQGNSQNRTAKCLQGLPNRVESLTDIKAIQAKVRKELIGSRNNTSIGPFALIYSASEGEVFLDGCGPMTIKQELRCYLGIPVQIPARFTSEYFESVYRLLRETFDFLVSFRDPGSWARGRSEQAARIRAKQLGFDIFGTGSHIYVPCEYRLLDHLILGFTELRQSGIHIDVIYDVTCGQISPLEIYEMAKIQELGNVSFELGNIEDYRYLKLQQLVKPGEKRLRLRCRSAVFRSSVQCTNRSFYDVLWRSGNDLIFNEKMSPSENIYVTPDCDLEFREVHYYDLDIYYCYLRDPSNTYKVWSQRPHIAYRLQMYKEITVWPPKSHVMIGLVILIIWSVMLTILWMILNLYDTTIRDDAMFDATVKEAGGRLNRLTMLYSPFSDEDRNLFFRMMENDLQMEKD